MTVARWLLGMLGVAGVGVGAARLLDRPGDLGAVLGWLVGGVLAHDAVLAPAVIAFTWWMLRTWGPWPGPMVAGAVVLGTVSLVAIPVLGGFGARADNATLLDRHYLLGWLLLAAVVAVVTTVATVRGILRGGEHGPGAGGR